MFKKLIFFVVLLPLGSFAQISISGRVLSAAGNKPVANASVFLSNATIGDKTAADGTFTLYNVSAGKYELIVSLVGFEAYNQPVTTANTNITLADITISPKTIILQEVVVKPDNNRDRNYGWFKDQFLGTSDLAKECKILNPEILDLDYDDATNTLTASTTDFLEIENDALGYKIKYLLKNFSFVNKDFVITNVYYQGSVLFEELKGTAVQERRWQNRRQEVYENSEMHFLRAAINNRLEEEGFSVQQLSIYANPDRPPGKLIEAEIAYHQQLKKEGDKRGDSLTYWEKKAKLPATFQKLTHLPLSASDFVVKSDKPGLYAIGCDYDGLYVTYSKSHHFTAAGNMAYLNTPRNTENTLINFNSPYVYFYANGVIANPYSVLFYGVWGRNRVAELLPINYNIIPDKVTAKAPVDSTAAKNITAKLNKYLAGHITENAYLHFDKPYYAAGDTIYFKAYITRGDSNKLTNLSGVLNAELINTNNKVSQSLKLQITDGVAWGDFALPDTLAAGNYRVRAYTRLMRDEKDDNYFDQRITVGSLSANNIAESMVSPPQIANKPDIQFFPEGGRLVNGISSKIAFKAISSSGLGINVKGQVFDDENKEVTTFASAHLGMGYFYINPVEGKSYEVKITYSDGSWDRFNLPVAIEKGIALAVDNNPKVKVAVTIAASKSFYQENKNRGFTLVINSAGMFSTFICKLDSQAVTLDVLKRSLHTGIASFTLFSPAGEPLSERLIFVQNNDQLNLSVKSNKDVYAPREKVTLKFNAKNSDAEPSSGHFSVAVIDESKVPVNEAAENTILTSLLLTGELKGYVEQPNYYFTNISDKTNADLDLVMLTHGYRRFEWKKLLKNEYPAVAAQPEKGLEIGGVVKAKDGKLLADGTVSLLSTLGGPVHSREIDGNGAFRFSDLAFMDSTRFLLKATNEKLKNKTNITYNVEEPAPVTANLNLVANPDDLDRSMATYLDNRKIQVGELAKYGSPKGIMLKQVNIKTTKKDDDYRTASMAGAGNADQVIHRKDFQGSGLFSDYFEGRLIGVTFRGTMLKKAYLTVPLTLSAGAGPAGNGGSPPSNKSKGSIIDAPAYAPSGNPPMLIVLDGVKIEGSQMSVDEINVQDIETVEVLRNSSASIYGSLGGAGVLVITTRQGGDDPVSRYIPPGFLPVVPKGYYKAREFYAPKYDHKENNFNGKDLRSTIYWNPELVTDADGNAVFNYYNADGPGSYRVVIEGIDDKGNLGRQVYRYRVE